MKTLRMICLIAGLTALSTSCKIFHKNKSGESNLTKNISISTPDNQKIANELLALSLKSRLNEIIRYAQHNGYSTEYFFLINMGIWSGKNRFFVYDMRRDSIALSGLVAHGNCNNRFLEQARFSNATNCGCSSSGKYKVGPSYRGEFGKSYRLYGLDSTNSNAFKRAIVLHGFRPVPDQEIYPQFLCNSFGCPMVSASFFDKLSEIIDRSEKPILLWIFQ